jgi:hypothetical protein
MEKTIGDSNDHRPDAEEQAQETEVQEPLRHGNQAGEETEEADRESGRRRRRETSSAGGRSQSSRSFICSMKLRTIGSAVW